MMCQETGLSAAAFVSDSCSAWTRRRKENLLDILATRHVITNPFPSVFFGTMLAPSSAKASIFGPPFSKTPRTSSRKSSGNVWDFKEQKLICINSGLVTFSQRVATINIAIPNGQTGVSELSLNRNKNVMKVEVWVRSKSLLLVTSAWHTGQPFVNSSYIKPRKNRSQALANNNNNNHDPTVSDKRHELFQFAEVCANSLERTSQLHSIARIVRKDIVAPKCHEIRGMRRCGT